jgi:hypothetical protein
MRGCSIISARTAAALMNLCDPAPKCRPYRRLRLRRFKAKEYRKQAEECLELAKAATEPFVAMMELAGEFNKAAEELEHTPLAA